MIFFLMGLACSDYEFNLPSGHPLPGESDPSGITEGTDSGQPDAGPGDSGEPIDTGTPPDDGTTDSGIPDDDGPPDRVLDRCTPDVRAEFQSGEIYVLSWDRNEDEGVLWVEQSGWYHLYDVATAESGSSQPNESAYLRVSNTTIPNGKPLYGNCGDEWVEVDSDNSGALPADARVYAGTFWLLAGDNQLSLHHLCPTVRGGHCGDLENTADASGTCDSDNMNSVHYTGAGLCLVRAF